MDLRTGELTMMSESELIKECGKKFNRVMKQIDTGDLTAKQLRDNKVKLRDHTSKAGKIRQAGIKKIGRNTPCPCGSGVKFKKCCLR